VRQSRQLKLEAKAIVDTPEAARGSAGHFNDTYGRRRRGNYNILGKYGHRAAHSHHGKHVMSVRYSHTQTGMLLRIAALLPMPFMIGAAALADDTRVLAAGVPLIVVVCLAGLAFSSLTIEIDADALRWSFGFGVFRKRIALEDIASATPVRNPWWYGLGIHRTPRGWLYNVAGLDAVEICLRNGRTLRLGTDEPSELIKALAARR